VAVVVALLDQIAKAVMTGMLSGREDPELWIVEPLISLRLVHNTGLVFGMFSGRSAP